VITGARPEVSPRASLARGSCRSPKLPRSAPSTQADERLFAAYVGSSALDCHSRFASGSPRRNRTHILPLRRACSAIELAGNGAPSRPRTCTNGVLKTAPLPIGLSGLGSSGGIRTLTARFLRPPPLPFGLRCHRRQREALPYAVRSRNKSAMRFIRRQIP
jgi:hypothetical protein